MTVRAYIVHNGKAAPLLMALPGFGEVWELVAGQLNGVPTIGVMAGPFVVGVVAGYIGKKVLRWALLGVIAAIVGSILGIVNLAPWVDELRALAAKYGPESLAYLSLLIGVLPLGVGFGVGFLMGFLVA